MTQSTSRSSKAPIEFGIFKYCGNKEGIPLLCGDAPEHNRFDVDAQRLPIHDMRGSGATLEREGFLHGHLPFDIGLEEDIEIVAKAYRPLVEEYIRDLTSAPKVVSRLPILRWSHRTPRPGRVSSYPADFVHADFSHETFHNMAAQCVADDPERDRWLSGRYAVLQTWRVFSQPPQDMPLAVIDQRTVAAEDVVLMDSIVTWSEDAPKTQSYTFRHNPAHRWNYISDMTTDDVLVFTGFDTADETVPGIAHAAFDYASTTDRATNPRMSCELRAFVYWG